MMFVFFIFFQYYTIAATKSTQTSKLLPLLPQAISKRHLSCDNNCLLKRILLRTSKNETLRSYQSIYFASWWCAPSALIQI